MTCAGGLRVNLDAAKLRTTIARRRRARQRAPVALCKRPPWRREAPRLGRRRQDGGWRGKWLTYVHAKVAICAFSPTPLVRVHCSKQRVVSMPLLSRRDKDKKKIHVFAQSPMPDALGNQARRAAASKEWPQPGLAFQGSKSQNNLWLMLQDAWPKVRGYDTSKTREPVFSKQQPKVWMTARNPRGSFDFVCSACAALTSRGRPAHSEGEKDRERWRGEDGDVAKTEK